MAKPHEIPAEFKQYGEPVKSCFTSAFLVATKTYWIFQKGFGMQEGKKEPVFVAWSELEEVRGLRQKFPDGHIAYEILVFPFGGKRYGIGPSTDPAVIEFGTFLIAIFQKYKQAKLVSSQS